MLKIEREQLEELREKAAEFNRAWVARGRKLTAWTCPDCTARIEVRRPRRVDVGDKGFWDSLTTCTSCGRILFVVTFPDGTTTVQRTRPAGR